MIDPRDCIILPLDVGSMQLAKSVVESTQEFVGGYRITDKFTCTHGLEAAEPITSPIFLDLKMSGPRDVVSFVMKQVSETLGSFGTYITVGPFIGHSALMEAVKTANPNATVLIATPLTVLSLDDAKKLGCGPKELHEQTVGIIKHALEYGVIGCLCSPFEVAQLRKELGEKALIVCDEIPEVSAAEVIDALEDGADLVIMNRLLLAKRDRVEILEHILKSVAHRKTGSKNVGHNSPPTS